MFFLAIVSVVYIVAYTIYCQTYHMGVAIDVWCIFLLSVILGFFYVLSQHEHRYLYLMSITIIPIILISSLYWMTWISPGQDMRQSQWIFFVVHTLLYMLCIYRKEGVVIIKRRGRDKDTNSEGNGLLLTFPLIIIMMYAIVWWLPSSIDRLPASEAYNYIDMICTDTDIMADDVIEKAKGEKIYDETSSTYDIAGFMRFLSEELGEQLWKKRLIEEGSVPEIGLLRSTYINLPRRDYE